MTATTQQVKLTAKQQTVLDMLEAGAEVPVIAKRLKITPSGVYGHIRNIRKAGVTLPDERMEQSTTPAAPAPTAPAAPAPAPAEASSNGHVEPEAALRTALEELDKRQQDIETEVSELNSRAETLREESAGLAVRREKLNAAIAALTA